MIKLIKTDMIKLIKTHMIKLIKTDMIKIDMIKIDMIKLIINDCNISLFSKNDESNMILCSIPMGLFLCKNQNQKGA